MKILYLLLILSVFACQQNNETDQIENVSEQDIIEESIKIDSVWAGHPVRFCLYTHENRQYIAYYNANRNMVVGQRNLEDESFELHVMPATQRETAGGTSTVLGWDSHNSVTLAIDRKGFIHLSGNMHVNPLTYFKSTKPNDITTLVQETSQVGYLEDRCTYPKFMLTKEGDLLFHYRDGGSGNGNEIYNIYSCETKQWSRMLDTPFTDGQSQMNAYQSQPTLKEDGWYHVYWVWRDTPDCSTNHDLSYMKSPDLKQWYSAFGEEIKMPATLDQRKLIVDPIPVKGGIINLAAKLCLDENQKPVFTYHKYDADGNLQLYIAHTNNGEWNYKQISNWNHRWEFSGNGSLNDVEFRLKSFERKQNGNYEVSYWHAKHGYGTIVLNKDFENIHTISKAAPFVSTLEVEGEFEGLQVQTRYDDGNAADQYLLKWETLDRNRDKPRPKPWPQASTLYLYKLSSK